MTKELDATHILDQFVYEHPDFSLNGAKAIFSLTGYQGILGYRTRDDRDIAADSRPPRVRCLPRERDRSGQARHSAFEGDRLDVRQPTWYILDFKPLQTVINDTELGGRVARSSVETQILFYPHGGRPDGDDWHQTGERFKYLQSQGFRIFASVGTSSFSYVKPDISAVICDRLHPDGTTLRHSRSRYLQFYNAEDIMDTQGQCWI